MKLLRLLADPAVADLYWSSLLAAIGVAVLCGCLSVFTVLRRLGAMGQGISHAGFGGAGIAIALGLGTAPVGRAGVVLVFCLGAALVIGIIARRGREAVDTAIAIVLVATMALGSLLVAKSARGHWRLGAAPTGTISLESLLFGSIAGVTPADAALSWAAAGVVLLVLWLVRRPMLLWMLDEPAAEVAGVPVARMQGLLLVLMTVAIVVAMRVVGVVLATALLVLPGAIACQWSRSMASATVGSIAASALGAIAGLALAVEIEAPAGPCVVLTLCAIYALARAARAASDGRGAKYPSGSEDRAAAARDRRTSATTTEDPT